MTDASESISPPVRLTPEHVLADFDSGEPGLDDWLKRRALDNEKNGGSRTYVICAEGRVVGFYCLANGAVTHEEAVPKVSRGMPKPVPAMILGRLAVDRTYQGKGLGAALLRDAILRTLQAAEIAGIRVIFLHAVSDRAKRFYERHGFVPSPVHPMTMMITLADALAALEG